MEGGGGLKWVATLVLGGGDQGKKINDAQVSIVAGECSSRQNGQPCILVDQSLAGLS
jgi:hypothetical protein